MTEKSVQERIGVSTLFMQSNSETETVWEGLDLAWEAGFSAVEIVPTNCQGHSGWPRTRFCVGVDLETITTREKDRLAKSVSRFAVRNVHGLHRDLNIAARNRGIARESVRQYMQCADLALAVDAQTVTFHMGYPNRQEGVGDDAFVIDRNVEFGKRIAEFCERNDLKTGYENGGGFPSVDQMIEIIERVGSGRFGFHFDVGHVWLSETRDPVKWAQALSGRVVAVHIHGTFHRPDRTFENHMPLELDECTDFGGMFRALDDGGFDGPVIFEVIAKDISTYIEMCKRSRDILLAATEGG